MNYFEWEPNGTKKTKYAIRAIGSDITYLGGLYTVPAGGRLTRFTILTRPPAASIAFIHDRMPVLIPPSTANEWLDPQISFDELMQDSIEDVEYQVV